MIDKRFPVFYFILLFCFLAINSWAQEEWRKERLESDGMFVKGKSWDQNYKNKKQYEISSFHIDTAIVYPIIRDVISPKYRDLYNGGWWYVETILNSDGDIIAVAFLFKRYFDCDTKEMAELAIRIREEAKWKIIFHQKPEYKPYYITLSFRAPIL